MFFIINTILFTLFALAVGYVVGRFFHVSKKQETIINPKSNELTLADKRKIQEDQNKLTREKVKTLNDYWTDPINMLRELEANPEKSSNAMLPYDFYAPYCGNCQIARTEHMTKYRESIKDKRDNYVTNITLERQYANKYIRCKQVVCIEKENDRKNSNRDDIIMENTNHKINDINMEDTTNLFEGCPIE